jgi:WD40 repeat protein
MKSLHEHVFLELLEKGDRDLCAEFLKESVPLQSMRSSDPLSAIRYRRLENLIQNFNGDSHDLYKDSTREQRRSHLGASLANLVQEAPKARLLSLISESIELKRTKSILPVGDGEYDIMTGIFTKDSGSDVIRSCKLNFKPATGSVPQSLAYHPSGKYIAVGSSDGLIEIYDTENWEVSQDLKYQQSGDFIVHEKSVTAIRFDKSGSFLGTGDQNGDVALWEFQSGSPIQFIPSCHAGAVVSMDFHPSATRVVTSAVTGTIRINGSRSHQALQSLTVENAYATSVRFVHDGDKIVLGCNDGRLLVYSSRSGELLHSHIVETLGVHGGVPRAIREIRTVTMGGLEMVIVCSNGNTAKAIDLDSGQTRTEYKSGVERGDDFTLMTLSPTGLYTYFISERGNLYCFDLRSAEPKNVASIGKTEMLCASHHPMKSEIAAVGSDGTLYILGK